MSHHPLHALIANQLAGFLTARRVVVWFDPKGSFRGFIEELRTQTEDDGPVVTVRVGVSPAALAEWRGSFFRLRHEVEGRFSVERPDPILIYVPTERPALSPLLEHEKAGMVFNDTLKAPSHYAREILRRNLTDSEVDAILEGGQERTYAELAKLLTSGGVGGSGGMLKAALGDSDGDISLIAGWMADPGRDAEVESMGAQGELTKLLEIRLGLGMRPAEDLPALRRRTAEWVLAGEFRLDLAGEPPNAVMMVGLPSEPQHREFLRILAHLLRRIHPAAYITLADEIERRLGLEAAALPGERLGSIDTFRFEEKALLIHAARQIEDGRYAEARSVVDGRRDSFWLACSPDRRAQWEAVGAMAALGLAVEAAGPQISAQRGNAAVWVDSYARDDGWHRIDRLHREMETFAGNLHGDAENALLRVRRTYDALVGRMAEGFAKALASGGYTVPSVLHQSRIHAELVAPKPAPVAYFLVDALRFEMGGALKECLPEDAEVTLRPAVAALPTITPVGMAALLPGASTDFTVSADGGKLAGRIGVTVLADAASREKHLRAVIPAVKVLALDDVVSFGKEKLKREIAGAPLVVVRSGEIDTLGEAGHRGLARQAMGNVIGTLALAMRRLADAGIPHQVVSADHGHLFGAERGDEMKIEAPGGITVELHRRCWAGRGGATPPGCVRVSASELGYVGDYDLVFPLGTGVFKAGGDLAFHHGGISLQELVVPVLSAHLERDNLMRSDVRVSIDNLPDVMTSRVMAIMLSFDHGGLFDAESLDVRPLLVEKGRQVGAAAMALDGECRNGVVTLMRGKTVTVGLLLSDESASSIEVVVLDAADGGKLGDSDRIKVKLGVM